MLSAASLAKCREWYLQGRPIDPVNSPVLADLSKLPPALVLAGEIELFIDDIQGRQERDRESERERKRARERSIDHGLCVCVDACG
jgi:acetyl esterase/lipase